MPIKLAKPITFKMRTFDDMHQVFYEFLKTSNEQSKKNTKEKEAKKEESKEETK